MYVEYIRIRCSWKARAYWLSGADQTFWLVFACIFFYGIRLVEFLCIVISWIDPAIIGTSFDMAWGGTIMCPGFPVLLAGWSRGWALVYYDTDARMNLQVVAKMLIKMGPLTAFVSLLFTGHFFVYQGISQRIVIDAGLYKEGFGVGDDSNAGDALYSLWGLLTGPIRVRVMVRVRVNGCTL